MLLFVGPTDRDLPFLSFFSLLESPLAAGLTSEAPSFLLALLLLVLFASLFSSFIVSFSLFFLCFFSFGAAVALLSLASTSTFSMDLARSTKVLFLLPSIAREPFFFLAASSS